MLPEGTESTGHIMLSYEWGCQQSVLLIKSGLEKAGYKVSLEPSAFGPALLHPSNNNVVIRLSLFVIRDRSDRCVLSLYLDLDGC